MEVCMKCQQSGINYLKDSTMYNIFQWSQATRHLGGQFSRGCLWRFSFHVLCIGECCVAPWPPGPSLGTSLITIGSPPSGRSCSNTQSILTILPLTLPSSHESWAPCPSCEQHTVVPLSSPPSFSRHGVTGWEWTHTQSNVCPLSKSEHWETFNIHNLSFREIQNI